MACIITFSLWTSWTFIFNVITHYLLFPKLCITFETFKCPAACIIRNLFVTSPEWQHCDRSFNVVQRPTVKMSISADYLHLNDHKIIKNIRESLPKGIVKTLNLLTVKDDVLFVWNCQDNCMLTLNVKAVRSKEGDSVNYQVSLIVLYWFYDGCYWGRGFCEVVAIFEGELDVFRLFVFVGYVW